MQKVVVSYVPYILIGLPVFMSLCLYYLGVRFSGSKWKALHKSVQWTAIFYMIAVVALIKMMFGYLFIGYSIILLIVILATILIIQWKKDTEVVLLNGLKLMWRISFLIFSITYLGLIIYKVILFIMLQNES